MNTFRSYKYINNIDINQNTIPHTNWEHIHNRHNSNAFNLPSHPETQTEIPLSRVSHIYNRFPMGKNHGSKIEFS